MIRRFIFVFAIAAAAACATAPSRAQQDAAPASPQAEAMRKALSSLAAGDSDEERNEHAALVSFYEARGNDPVWLTPEGALTSKAALTAAEIARADEWGLDPRDFPLPARFSAEADPRTGNSAASTAAPPEKIASDEIGLSLAILKYGRYARGGRIIDPSTQLSSYLDRRPQFIKPQLILDGIAATEAPDAYLRELNPRHPQFEKLRQRYLTLIGHDRPSSKRANANGFAGKTAEEKRLLANMEEWRWMPADMGSLYVWNNIPEFIQRVVKDGAVIRTERFIAGQIGKQTPVFSHPMRKITFKPTWIVPDSIKVRELLPNIQRGGRLLRQWGLEVRTKDGQPVDLHKINWSSADIREYDIIQPNGPWSVMGKVKFSFPNQHTVFMHDTLPKDKFMFKSAQRTYSHGCMRVANPLGLAEILLHEDKGWDAARVAEAVNTGPLNNEIALDRKIPVHITYFTVIASDDGKLNTFPDVYGHERRIVLALEGRWNEIVKGRDHLAPVELDEASSGRARLPRDDTSDLPDQRRRSGGSFLDAIFGGDRL